MRSLVIGTIMAAAVSIAYAKDRPAAKQSCQEQAFGSLVRNWPGVTKGQFEIIEKDQRCLLFLQADSKMFAGKRAAWLIEGRNGDLLAEFYAPIAPGSAWKVDDRGLCSFRGGKFPTSNCTWADWMDKADQM
ncbi:hypothetical protein WDM22_26390 [Bradyrhizobium septentrionale]|uniref:hypothetical protein n=1 Tax=Bradyrhizobium septentrionale TaxID=1404411 RepID=UPI0030D0DC44